MPRIVAGEAGGRQLRVPPGGRTRPTADRTREALFSALGSLLDLEGARVLDLYAGSGALGLEALSRGAAAAVLVESDARAAHVLRENVRTLGLPGARVANEKVERFLAGPAAEPFDVVLADPPYAVPVEAALELLVRGGWLAPEAVLVVERSARDPDLVWPDGLAGLRSRRYGEAALWYGKRS